jgi:transposase-like protein
MLPALGSELPLALFSRLNPHRHPSPPIITTDLPHTLSDLEQQFATEEQCRQYLFHLRWPDGFCCPACGGATESQILRGLHLCHTCHHKTSSTAGTLFQDSHLPLTTWFRACWHVVSEENGLSASGLQRALGLPRRKTAWTILQKLRCAMVRPGQARLSGTVQLGMTYWAAQPIGDSAPLTEGAPLILIAAEEDVRGIGLIRLQFITEFTPANAQAFVDEAIEPGSTILTDDNRSSRDTHGCQSEQKGRLLPLPPRVLTLLDFWLRRTYRGVVSLNHLDAYLNEFTFRFNWRSSASTAELFYRLLQQSIQLQPAPFTAPHAL